MRKFITAGVAALTVAGSLGVAAAPAMAEPHGGWHGGYHGGWHDRDGGDWDGGGWGYVGAGLAGLAIGSALAAPYDYGYYPRYYDDDDGYYRSQTCVSTRRTWDPYVGHYVIRRFYYAC